MDLSAITCLRREWECASRSPHSHALLRELNAREPDLASVHAPTLHNLYRAAQSSEAEWHIDPWRITTALVRQFDRDQLIGVGLLANLRPGLLSIARLLDWGRSVPWGDAETLGADLLETAWEVLGSLAGSTVAYPERTVLRLVRQRLERQRDAARRQQRREIALDQRVERADPHPLPVLDELSLALRLRCADIASRDLHLIHAHRVVGLTFPELAASSGISVKTLEQRSHRAEAVLSGTRAHVMRGERLHG